MFGNITRVAGAAFIAVTFSNNALAEPANMESFHSFIEVSQITSMISELDIPTEVVQLEGGNVIIVAKVAENKTMLIAPDFCGDGPVKKCTAVMFLAMAPPVVLPSPSLAQNLAVINVLNGEMYFGKSYILDGDVTVLSRLMIADFGYTKGNFISNFLNSIAAADVFYGTLASLKQQGLSFDAPLTDAPSISLSHYRNSEHVLRSKVLSTSARPGKSEGATLSYSASMPLLTRKAVAEFRKSRYFFDDYAYTAGAE